MISPAAENLCSPCSLACGVASLVSAMIWYHPGRLSHHVIADLLDAEPEPITVYAYSETGRARGNTSSAGQPAVSGPRIADALGPLLLP